MKMTPGIWQELVKKMPEDLAQLKSSKLLSREELTEIPEKGIYVLYEENKPMYVGRSDHLKTRIQTHSRPSSGHGQSSLAFNLAREEASKQGIRKDIERSKLEKDP